MSRRSHSASPGPRDAKRPRLDYLTPDDYRNGVMLAPMVRSGARTSAVHRAVRLDELTHCPQSPLVFSRSNTVPSLYGGRKS